MGRNVQISKEKILRSGLEMLIRNGYKAINITSLARETGCSTQPVAWHFGSMEKFRVELADYVDDYVISKIRKDTSDPLEAFLRTGDIYVDMAYDEPNVIRFMLMDSEGSRPFEGISYIFDDEKNSECARPLAEKLRIPEDKVRMFMRSMLIYTQGLVTIIASGAANMSRETAHGMLRKSGIMYLVSIGVSRETAEMLYTLEQKTE